MPSGNNAIICSNWKAPEDVDSLFDESDTRIETSRLDRRSLRPRVIMVVFCSCQRRITESRLAYCAWLANSTIAKGWQSTAKSKAARSGVLSSMSAIDTKTVFADGRSRVESGGRNGLDHEIPEGRSAPRRVTKKDNRWTSVN